MTYDIALLKADIIDELGKLNRLVEEYVKVAPVIAQPAESVTFLERSGIGYILHNFYNGCENIFRSIALFFENDLSPQSWHRDLLKRMTMNVDGYRPRVVDEQLYLILNDLRSFRHKFRHLYGFELEWEREQAIAQKLPKAMEMLNSQLHEFMKLLDLIVE